ncbi:MAG: glycosyltransferase [Phycisphaerales bacterium]|nr:MAG: glycosyltransferase [Phycisphaerales bacterium]
MLRLEDFRHIVPDETLAEIYARARKLYGKHIIHLNATYQGGGVAEILYSLAMLMNDVGIDAGWRILHGSQEFFEITKSFHNALQGAKLNLSERKKRLYRMVNENFSRFTHLAHDCVIVHDPQPLALIASYRKQQPWIWRCHIDLTDPHAELWDFLKGFVLKYDQMVVSSEKYFKEDLPVDQRLMYPAINPLSPKNVTLSERAVQEQLSKAGVPLDKPLITQVSRLDPWKDPEGVIDVFKMVKQQIDCRLVLCYNVASDDPEGLQMYKKVQRKANRMLESDDILLVVGNSEKLVNAIQRHSQVVIQKSTKEGFCLAVTEAMWKGTPVVASNVGGIPAQIENGKSGYLLKPRDLEGFAERIVHLLKHRDEAEELGRQARERVREKFLITRLLSDYLDMLNAIMA